MSDILSKIEDGMYDLISGITIGDGYNFDWGTVNEPDTAKQTFPSAEIVLESENNLDETGGVWSGAYEQEAIFVIRVRTELSNEVDTPAYTINIELNKALEDLKKLFGINYSVSDSCDTIMYRGMIRTVDRSNDILRPAYMDTRWRVAYTQDRTNPAIIDE